MPLKVIVSPNIVNDISKFYQKIERVFMEYIDNSLDSAEKEFFNSDTNSYSKPIEILIKINSKNQNIKFIDNCKGMTKDEILRIVENVGDSVKKGDSSTNGQFGYGIHAYAAVANQIEILSSTKECIEFTSIKIDASRAYNNNSNVDDPSFITKPQNIELSGTEVTISKFKKSDWKEFEPENLKIEIERHFEQLLNRNNLSIKVIIDNKEFICESYDYSKLNGKEFNFVIDKIHGERNSLFDLKNLPIIVYLKISEDKLDRLPVFTNKGRRIENVHKIEKFINLSNRKSSVWKSSYLTGFIEVNGRIEPTLDRKDFQKKGDFKNIFREIINSVEEEIYNSLEVLLKKDETAGYDRFEDLLSGILSDFAKEERLKTKQEFEENPDGNINLGIGKEEVEVQSEGQSKFSGNESENKSNIIRSMGENSENTLLKGNSKRKSGYKIKFSDQIQKDYLQREIRSDLIEDTIYIYKEHYEYKNRKSEKNPHEITSALISYIAGEISIHFKDEVFNKNKKQIDNMERKEQFSSVIEFIHSFENSLRSKNIEGKSIFTLENLAESNEQ